MPTTARANNEGRLFSDAPTWLLRDDVCVFVSTCADDGGELVCKFFFSSFFLKIKDLAFRCEYASAATKTPTSLLESSLK